MLRFRRANPPSETWRFCNAGLGLLPEWENCSTTLGSWYMNGEGVPQDYETAHVWLNLAAARLTGEQRDQAVREQASKARDALAAQMTREQTAEARRRAREWDEAHPREP